MNWWHIVILILGHAVMAWIHSALGYEFGRRKLRSDLVAVISTFCDCARETGGRFQVSLDHILKIINGRVVLTDLLKEVGKTQ
jgi:hypothetical protein